MSCQLAFYFNAKDPQFKTTTTVVNNTPGNYIAHVFITSPIYDHCDHIIGTKVTDDYIQQTGENKYYVRINSTYFLEKGTISWQYAFENDKQSVLYPINLNVASNIIATTKEYLGKTGIVTLFPRENGIRDVTIHFN